jgi:hypothetical protein
MAGDNYRIEKGQKLSSAVSARAWNRAQDAADVVLGSVTSFDAVPGKAGPASLVVPCLVTTTINKVLPGHIVTFTGVGAKDIPDYNNSNDKRVARVHSLTAEVTRPVSYDNYENNNWRIGVIVSGVEMPVPGTPRMVNVCIGGLCVARVIQTEVGVDPAVSVGGRFIRGCVIRAPGEETSLIGLAEQASCGPAEIIHFIAVGTSSNPLWQYCAVRL